MCTCTRARASRAQTDIVDAPPTRGRTALLAGAGCYLAVPPDCFLARAVVLAMSCFTRRRTMRAMSRYGIG